MFKSRPRFLSSPATPAGSGTPTPRQVTGADGEARALAYLQQQGLQLVERNYRVARGRSRHAGELDLILRDRDGTLVFVEVRTRRSREAGGAAASVSPAKQARLIYAAQHYLARLPRVPPCRFDVIAIDGDELAWLRGAFDTA